VHAAKPKNNENDDDEDRVWKTERLLMMIAICSHCHENDAAFCSSCVAAALRNAHERRQDAWNRWSTARHECKQHFRNSKNDRPELSSHSSTNGLLELQAISDEWRQTVEARRQLCAEGAVRVCALRVQNEEQQRKRIERSSSVTTTTTTTTTNLNSTSTNTTMDQLRLQRQQTVLHDLEEIVLDGLSTTLAQSHDLVRTVRYTWALECFNIYPLQVDEQYLHKGKEGSSGSGNNEPQHQLLLGSGSSSSSGSTTTMGGSTAGISKICGLPLPNAGSELLGVLPASELQSALRYTAALTQQIAQCLNIPLPHPIRLSGGDHYVPSTDIIATTTTTEPGAPTSTTTTTSAATTTTTSITTMTAQERLQNIQFATTAWIYESVTAVAASANGKNKKASSSSSSSSPASSANANNHHPLPFSHSSSSLYRLADSRTDEFQIAWQFLQNDIFVLCLQAGVPIHHLSSGEAVLVNLHALQRHIVSRLALSPQQQQKPPSSLQR
jgi:hypothetical protein